MLPRSEPAQTWYKNLTAEQIIDKAIKIGLGGVGTLSVFLYVGPAEACAKIAGCGAGVSQVLTETGTTVVGVIGGATYGGANVALGAEAISGGKKALSIPDSKPGKVLMATWLLVYSGASVAQVIFASLATSDKFLHTLLAGIGAVPAAAYGASNMTANELQHLLSSSKHFMRKAYQSCVSLSLEEQHAWNRLQSYADQQRQFNRQLHANYKKFIETISQAEIVGTENPRELLQRQHADANRSESFFANTMHFLGNVAAAGLTAAMSYPLLNNTANFVEDITGIENNIAQSLLASMIGSTLYYGYFKLNNHVTTAVFDSITDVIRGKPINSLLWQLDRYKTAGAVAVSTLLSAYSFVVVGVIWRNLYPEDSNNILKIEAYASKAGIDLYHLGGSMKLIEMLWRALTKDQKAKVAFEVKAEYLALTSQTLEQHIKFCETDPQAASIFDLHTFKAESDIEESVPLLFETSSIPMPQKYSQSNLLTFAQPPRVIDLDSKKEDVARHVRSKSF